MKKMNKKLARLKGKTIIEASVWTGGAYMECDDRSLELKFSDGSSFIMEVRTRKEVLQGEAIYYEAGKAKTNAEEEAQRHVLRNL